jgi:hypothetical protein
MSITDLSAETTIVAGWTKDLTNLQVVSSVAVVGLLFVALVAAFGFSADVTQTLTSWNEALP